MFNPISATNFGKQVHEIKQHDREGPLGQAVSGAAHRKNDAKQALSSSETVQQQVNVSILQYDADTSVGAGGQSLELLYRTAIDGINEVLGEDAIQIAADSGLDVSPEATAERIVSMSTAFFPSYLDQHPEMTEEEAVEKFSDLIGGGIEKGFSEARDILAGLKVLEGDIASNIDKTYEFVQSGLQAFIDSFSDTPQSGEEDDAPLAQ